MAAHIIAEAQMAIITPVLSDVDPLYVSAIDTRVYQLVI